MSFVEQAGVMALVEGLLQYSWPPELGGLSQPFPCITYSEAMRDYGSDKPDTRFHMKVLECVCVCMCENYLNNYYQPQMGILGILRNLKINALNMHCELVNSHCFCVGVASVCVCVCVCVRVLFNDI